MKKGYIGLPNTLGLLALKYCSDAYAVIAVDANDNGGEPAVMVYRLPLMGPPSDWEGYSKQRVNSFLLGERCWPAPIEHELIWTCSISYTTHSLTSIAFKPLPQAAIGSQSPTRAQDEPDSVLDELRVASAENEGTPGENA